MGMALGLLTLAVGFVLGRLSVRRYRRDRIAWAQRRLQLQVLSIELKSLRSKVVSAHGRRTPPAERRLVRMRPTLQRWQKRLIAWLHLHFPWLTRFMRLTARGRQPAGARCASLLLHPRQGSGWGQGQRGIGDRRGRGTAGAPRLTLIAAATTPATPSRPPALPTPPT